MPHKPTPHFRRKVKSCAKVGIPQDQIAMLLGIDAKTLRKYYREELDTAAIAANEEIGGALFEKAKKGDTVALIWWTKARMGWRGEDKKEELDKAATPSVMVVPMASAEDWAEMAAKSQDALKKAAKD